MNKFPQKQREAESGNVLFLILIAVALFAALSYAVTQSSRSGGGDANTEKNLISSAQLTQYPAGIRTAIVRMLINGIDVTELVFNPPADFGSGKEIDDSDPDDAAAMKIVHAAVFHPLGGGATYSPAPGDIMSSGQQTDWIFTGDYEVLNIGTSVATSPDGNDVLALLVGVSNSVCKKIDAQLGITSSSADWVDGDSDGLPGAGASVGLPPATLADKDHMVIPDVGDPATGIPNEDFIIGGSFTGQPYGCFDEDDGAAAKKNGVYYHVLVER